MEETDTVALMVVASVVKTFCKVGDAGKYFPAVSGSKKLQALKSFGIRRRLA